MEEKDSVKKTTKKRATTKKVKVEEEKKTMSIEDIPQELIAQIIAMARDIQKDEKKEDSNTKTVVKKGSKSKGKATKADLIKNKDKEVILKGVRGTCSFKSSKTNILYRWTSENDEETMTVAEILNMESKSKRYLHTPWLVLSEDFDNGETIKMIIEALGLEEVYTHLIDVDELLDKELCDIEDILKETSDEYKEIISSKIMKKIADKELRDMILVRELERMLGKSFM